MLGKLQSSEFWQMRLGHINNKAMLKLVKESVLSSSNSLPKINKCGSCLCQKPMNLPKKVKQSSYTPL